MKTIEAERGPRPGAGGGGPPGRPREIVLVRAGFPGRPGLDTAVAHAVLDGVSSGSLPETLRLHVPGRVLAFGRRDVVAPGYRRAVAAARAAGFTPIERLAGGRAAVFHEGTIAFSWAMPDPYPPDRIRARFTEVSGLLAAGLHAVGVDARVGEVPGEYCPGEFSINGGGRVKLVGIGQRLVRRAAHVGGVIVVRDAGLVRDALRPVYRELGLPWDPATAGAVADLVPGITVDGVITAVIAAVGATHRLVPGDLDPATLEAAEALRPRHLPVGAGTPVG